MLESDSTLLPRIFRGFLGQYLHDLHRTHEVDVRTGVSVAALEGHTFVEVVKLSDGTLLAADVVVVGLSVRL